MKASRLIGLVGVALSIPCSVFGQSTDATADYSTVYGEWHGQTQFKEAVEGGYDRTAHLFTPLKLKIEAGGKVSGGSDDAGCRLLGIARPGSAIDVTLDLTVSSCRDSVFNRRYTGSFALNTRREVAEIRLHSLPPTRYGKPATYEITATLKR